MQPRLPDAALPERSPLPVLPPRCLVSCRSRCGACEPLGEAVIHLLRASFGLAAAFSVRAVVASLITHTNAYPALLLAFVFLAAFVLINAAEEERVWRLTHPKRQDDEL